MQPAAETSELRCPDCAGHCTWQPDRAALECASCGNTRRLETAEDAASHVEHPYDPEAPEPASEVPVLPEARAHQCRGCGGEILFTGAALSERCPYCDGPVVLGTADPGYRSTALIPFRIMAEEAQSRALAWAADRRAAPTDLSTVVGQGRVAGLYAPFWTFDSREAVTYWAKYVTGSGKHRRVHDTSGKLGVVFDDLLMPASPHVTPLIRDGILHDFSPRALRPFRAGYLAGFAAERHHQSVAQGLAANEPDKKLLIRNRIKGHVAKRGVHDIGYKTDTTGIHYRRILLPVWILHYRYNDTPMKVVVSGIDGRTFGERPYSTLKIAAYAAALTAAAFGFGVLWGMAGWL